MPKGVFKHKPHSIETRLKMSLAMKGKMPKNLSCLHNLSPEVEKRRRINLGLANKGKLLGYKHSEEAKLNMGLSKKGHKTSRETRDKISLAKKGGKYKIDKNKHDKTKLKKSDKKHLDTQYKYWMIEVKKRDNWKCKIDNEGCKGRLEAHHILPWRDYPELRYKLNNGITLCLAHHPRKRSEEKRLSPYFMELVSVSKE